MRYAIALARKNNGMNRQKSDNDKTVTSLTNSKLVISKDLKDNNQNRRYTQGVYTCSLLWGWCKVYCL